MKFFESNFKHENAIRILIQKAKQKQKVKLVRAHGGCLGAKRRRRTR